MNILTMKTMSGTGAVLQIQFCSTHDFVHFLQRHGNKHMKMKVLEGKLQKIVWKSSLMKVYIGMIFLAKIIYA